MSNTTTVEDNLTESYIAEVEKALGVTYKPVATPPSNSHSIVLSYTQTHKFNFISQHEETLTKAVRSSLNSDMFRLLAVNTHVSFKDHYYRLLMNAATLEDNQRNFEAVALRKSLLNSTVQYFNVDEKRELFNACADYEEITYLSFLTPDAFLSEMGLIKLLMARPEWFKAEGMNLGIIKDENFHAQISDAEVKFSDENLITVSYAGIDFVMDVWTFLTNPALSSVSKNKIAKHNFVNFDVAYATLHHIPVDVLDSIFVSENVKYVPFPIFDVLSLQTREALYARDIGWWDDKFSVARLAPAEPHIDGFHVVKYAKKTEQLDAYLEKVTKPEVRQINYKTQVTTPPKAITYLGSNLSDLFKNPALSEYWVDYITLQLPEETDASLVILASNRDTPLKLTTEQKLLKNFYDAESLDNLNERYRKVLDAHVEVGEFFDGLPFSWKNMLLKPLIDEVEEKFKAANA